MSLIKDGTRHHTYADYLTWPDDKTGELVDGVAYIREPSPPARLHQGIVGGLYCQVAEALEDRASHVYMAPFEVRLPRSTEPDDEVDTVVQPDVLIVCDLHKLDARGMRGAPDWLAEVASPSTARYDQVVKLSAYERAGVREVWLTDPADRSLTIYHLAAGRYGRPAILGLRGKTQLSAVDGVTIDWDRMLAKLE